MAKKTKHAPRHAFSPHPALFAILLLATLPCLALEGLKADGSLDKEAISRFYFEGDFERALQPLESFRSSQRAYAKEDSLFLYKYLAVIYASRPETQNKGESYMYQLLRVQPSAHLHDMYISDKIEGIFATVKERYEKQQLLAKERAGHANPSEPKAPPTEKQPNNRKKWALWTLGGVGVAGAVATYVILSQEPEVKQAPPRVFE